MATKSSTLMENPKKPNKYINYQKAKDVSFFAFVFSIVVYISLSYIFNLSSSTLLHNPKFLFLISNALILIIAADYGAFSSTERKSPDLYDQYCHTLRTQERDSSSFVVPQQYPEETIVDKSSSNGIHIPMEEEKVITEVKHVADDDDHKKKIESSKTIQRTKSDKVKHVTFDSKKNDLHRSKSEIHEFPAERNEFSTMSDEELNRRVEQFIEKFNKQMRLQAKASLKVGL